MKISRPVLAWSLYDFANSAFTTLVVTFIFSAWFTQKIAPDPQRGTVLWSWAVNVSALAVAFSSPLLGAIADSSSRKKLFLFVASALCVVFTALLFFAGPGDVGRAWIFFVLANIGFEAGNVFYNAFLPEIADDESIGRVSGMGQALGYAGGLIALVIALGLIRGWLPVDKATAVRATNLLVAGWFALFALPLFLFVREEKRQQTRSIAEATAGGVRQLRATFLRLRDYREAAKLLLARLVYNDGLVTVFSFAGIFAAAAFGMGTDKLIILGIGLNVAAAIGSWVFGFVNDRIGGKKTIFITLVVLVIATAIGASARTVGQFWVAAILLGIMVGPNQSASRALLGQFVPERKHAEFFGFFAFSGKLASVAGPFVYGMILQATGSQRWSMASVGLFFVAGMVLLSFVDERRGREMARAA